MVKLSLLIGYSSFGLVHGTIQGTSTVQPLAASVSGIGKAVAEFVGPLRVRPNHRAFDELARELPQQILDG